MGGTVMGGGKTPIDVSDYTRPSRRTNQKQTIFGPFGRWVIATVAHRCHGATVALFIADDPLQPEICPFWACKWSNQIRGDLRERGEPCHIGRASSVLKPTAGAQATKAQAVHSLSLLPCAGPCALSGEHFSASTRGSAAPFLTAFRIPASVEGCAPGASLAQTFLP